MKIIYALGDVTCSHCAQVMETKMSAIPGVTSAMISFKLKKVTVNMDDDKEAEVESQVLNLIENPVYCKTCPNR
ncbi:heavy-metal-associated domain-containing protein [Faecalicatena contorta]|uniref:heavy-metal-associated domain-containing protein n=1 Tax=Faecalicatena contorta TaxID=39482 RepID=UPI001898E269|nr:cation transporter [Faecalicatena contorta]